MIRWFRWIFWFYGLVFPDKRIRFFLISENTSKIGNGSSSSPKINGVSYKTSSVQKSNHFESKHEPSIQDLNDVNISGSRNENVINTNGHLFATPHRVIILNKVNQMLKKEIRI